MKLKVDRTGRIVLPKRIRDRLHLHPGAELNLQEGPEGLVLRPVGQRASLIEKGGVLIHLGQAPRSFDWDRVVEDHREERLHDVAGLE